MCANTAAGSPDEFSSRTKRGIFYKLLSTLDLCFSSFIVAPLVIAFWSSTWSIVSFTLNAVPFADDQIIQASATIFFGFSISFVLTALQQQIQAAFSQYVSNKFLYFLGTRLYTEIFGIANVSTWYGIWIAVDLLTGPRVETIVAVVIISYLFLARTKTTQNVKSAPFVIVFDNKAGYFDAPTVFHTLQQPKKESKLMMLLDITITVLLIGTLVTLIWRGSWFLLDEVLRTDIESSSNYLSLAIGYFIVLVTYLSQSFVAYLTQNAEGWKGLIIMDIHIFITFCGAINIWRGVWNTLVALTNLENSLYISILVHSTSFLFLVAFQVSNTLLLRGACTETVENIDETVELPGYFTSQIHQEKKEGSKTAQIETASEEGKSDDNVDGDQVVDSYEMMTFNELNAVALDSSSKIRK